MKKDIEALNALLKAHIETKSLDELKKVAYILIRDMKDFEYLNYYEEEGRFLLYDENTGENIFPSDNDEEEE